MTERTDGTKDRGTDGATAPGRPAGAAVPVGGAAVAGSGGAGGLRALASRYALVPLRIFLGITFLYAGLDKLTDPAFLSATGSQSIGEMMRGVRPSSALPALVDLALHSPVGFGYALALGELAVGIGALLGLLTRFAAVGGALISLSLWLTVSWQASPYYLGNDLPYLVAWLPLLLAGAPVFSLDALLAERRRIR
ncbi:DoxX family protein [Streptomyces sp. NPDC101160]|uniref:DoxX family protein n=1 Tax=Streptomyces sp. NPDC101160 TaxID=3366118 RepID=UPI00382137E8